MLTAKKEFEALEQEGYDLGFVQRIQPQGDLVFKERYISAGDGYYSCLHVYTLPKDVSHFWLSDFTENMNTVTTFEISTAEKEKVLSAINKTMSEYSDRMENERTYTSRNDALDEFHDLQNFASQITQGGEIIKLLLIRIFVTANTLTELEEQIAEIKKKLTGSNYKVTNPILLQDEDFKSLFKSYGQQQIDAGFDRWEGISVPATAIGGGYPFNHQYLLDPFGTYIGTTDTGGAFVLDPFRVTEERTSFSGFLLGMPGAGKSTLLKMIEEGILARNCYVRGIEKNRDWYRLIQEQQGTILDLSGTDGLINPLEVFATRTDTTGLYIDELGSYLQHKAKVMNQIRFLNPDMKAVDALDFGSILDKFYIHWGLLEEGYMSNREAIHITGLPATSYPIMSDFLPFLDAQLEQPEYQLTTTRKKEELEKFRTVIYAMTNDYGALFNGHTTLTNLANEKNLFFDIDGISNLSDELFHCQLFTALTIVWNQAMLNGRKMKTLLERGEIDRDDVEYFLFFMDECQNIINVHNMFAVDYVVDFLKEMRKFSAGVYFATQSPQEILPEGTDSIYISKIKQVFELCQAKFFMHMDGSVIGRLKEVLGSQFTDSEFESLRTLTKGEVFISLGGKERYNVNVNPNEEQLERFAGGH